MTLSWDTTLYCIQKLNLMRWMDSIEIPRFNFFTKIKSLKKKSCGVALLLNKKINSAVEIIASDVKETLWFRLKDHNTKEDIVFIVVYNPPQDSRYTDPDIFNYIEKHVVRTRRQSFIGLEILHARAGNLSEVIIDDILFVRSNNDLHDVQNEVNQRVNKDRVVSNYGRMSTQMCKT